MGRKNKRVQKIIRSLFLSAVLCAIISAQTDPAKASQSKEVIDLNNRAVNLLNHNDYFSAYKLLTEAVKQDPHYNLARHNLSIVLLRWSNKYYIKQDFEKALRHSEKAEYYAPFSQEAVDQTRKCIRALKLNPESLQDRVQLANDAIARNAPDEFLAETCNAISLLNDYSNSSSSQNTEEYYEKRAKDLKTALGSSEAIELNNKAVALLHQKKYQEATQLLKKCLKFFPERELFRSNFSIALNNYALAMQDHPEVSLRLFEEALYYDFDNETTHHNLNGILRMLRLNPDSILVRLNLASKAIARNDLESAIADYRSAIKLTPKNPFLDQAKMDSKSTSDAKKNNTDNPLSEEERRFYEYYMIELQRKIKASWFPEKSKVSYRVVVSFNILKNGKISNLQIISSSAEEHSAAVLKAVRNAAPFERPLNKVPIQFTFDYNVWDKGGGGGEGNSKNREIELRRRRAIKDKLSKEVSHNPENLIKIDKYQALLAEKQKTDDKSVEAIDLRIKLVKLLVKEKYFELAEYLLEEGCELCPANTEMKNELIRVRKLLPKKPHPLPKNVG